MRATTCFERVRLSCMLHCAGRLVPANMRATRPVITQSKEDEKLIWASSQTLSKAARTRKDMLKKLPEFQFESAKVVKSLVESIHGKAGSSIEGSGACEKGDDNSDADARSEVPSEGLPTKFTAEVYMPWLEEYIPDKFDEEPDVDGMTASDLVRTTATKKLTSRQLAERTKLRKKVRDHCRAVLTREQDPEKVRRENAAARKRQRCR